MKRWLTLAAALMMGAASISCFFFRRAKIKSREPLTIEKKIVIYQVESDSAQIYELEQEGIRTIIHVTTHEGDEQIQKIVMITTEDLEDGDIELDTLMLMEIDEENVKMMKGDQITHIIKDGEVVVGEETDLGEIEELMLGLEEDLQVIEDAKRKVIIIESETEEEEEQILLED